MELAVLLAALGGAGWFGWYLREREVPNGRRATESRIRTVGRRPITRVAAPTARSIRAARSRPGPISTVRRPTRNADATCVVTGQAVGRCPHCR